jgi:hypothetical protein
MGAYMPVRGIHRFMFSRGDAADARRTRKEFKRLANLLTTFKYVLDAKGGIPRLKRPRDREASFALTVILAEVKKPGRDLDRLNEEVTL